MTQEQAQYGVPKIIVPTVGRMIWFYDVTDQPFAAIVVRVWGDRMVNLTVFNHDGLPIPHTSVVLVQPGDVKPAGSRYCTWMPYQIGQAARTDAEAKLASAEAQASAS